MSLFALLMYTPIPFDIIVTPSLAAIASCIGMMVTLRCANERDLYHGGDSIGILFHALGVVFVPPLVFFAKAGRNLFLL